MSIHLDFDRERRQGFGEAVYGEGKSEEQLREICGQFMSRSQPFMITRLSRERHEALAPLLAAGILRYGDESRCLLWHPQGAQRKALAGRVNLVCAGSSDLPVLAEAADTLDFHGVETPRICDVGVSGIHRLLARENDLRDAQVNIVVAGMEGALPSVVGGLVGSPVIAVPTSVGYGANFSGLSALLTMINSCASGVTVVNIDNGFGAAMAALRILQSVR